MLQSELFCTSRMASFLLMSWSNRVLRSWRVLEVLASEVSAIRRLNSSASSEVGLARTVSGISLMMGLAAMGWWVSFPLVQASFFRVMSLDFRMFRLGSWGWAVSRKRSISWMSVLFRMSCFLFFWDERVRLLRQKKRKISFLTVKKY